MKKRLLFYDVVGGAIKRWNTLKLANIRGDKPASDTLL